MVNQRRPSKISGEQALFAGKDLVDSLNGQRGFADELKIFVGLAPGGQEDPEIAARFFVATLRRLVDAWLQSSKEADGRDFPEQRKIDATKEPFASFQEWLYNNRPAPVLKASGEVEMQIKPAVKQWTGLVNLATDSARMRFFQLMSNPAKFALFKCSHHGCETYYLLEKPRGAYMRGSFCPKHRRQQGALRQRKQNQDQALKVAAEALAAWPSLSPSTRSKYKHEKDYIANKLKRFGLGSKWVTRNLTEIRESAR